MHASDGAPVLSLHAPACHPSPRTHSPKTHTKKEKKQSACAACPLVPSASIFLLSCLCCPGSSVHRAPIIAPQPAVGASTRQTNAYIPPTASFFPQVGATGPPLPLCLATCVQSFCPPGVPLCLTISVKSASQHPALLSSGGWQGWQGHYTGQGGAACCLQVSSLSCWRTGR